MGENAQVCHEECPQKLVVMLISWEKFTFLTDCSRFGTQRAAVHSSPSRSASDQIGYRNPFRDFLVTQLYCWRGGGASDAPPSRFSCVIAKRLEIES